MKTFFKFLFLTALFVPTFAFALDLTSNILDDLSRPDRVITMVGEVTEASSAEVVARIEALDRSAPGKEIELDITTVGGDVYAGLGVVDAMHHAISPIKTVCKGYCMSMGAVILASGTPGRRFAQPLATILIHQLSTQSQGSLAEIKNNYEEALRIEAVIDGIFTKATGLDEKTLQTEMNHDNFMTAQKAKELHIIDEVLK